jgi:subtilisin family serine protease
LVWLIAFALISSIWVAGVDAREDAKSRVIITFRDAPTGSDIRKVSDAGGKVTRLFTIVPSLAAELPTSAIERLRADPRVLLVEPDRRVQLLDAELDSAWGVKHIGSGLVHPTNQGAGVKVAVIDTGIDYNHPELDANYVGGYDYVNNDGNPMDDQGHGTMVSGVIAAEDNGSGVVGVAPQARLYGVKVLDASGSGWESDVIAGVDWARTNGMQVVNMSLGSSSASYSFQTAIANAQNAGLVLVAAAGNAGNCYGTGDNVSYPGRFSQVIAVAATDSSDIRACFSSTGPAVDIAAPGVSTLTTYRGGGYRSASGTSLASPHVAGTAALVIASGVSGNTAVRDRLLTTADDLGANGRDNLYGYGLVDADGAAGGGSPPPPPPSTHDVAVTSVSAPASVIQGNTADVGVTVANQGTVSETFTVTLRDGANTIGSSPRSLAAGASSTVNFSWNTTGVATGAHTLTATAGPVSGETDTADNSRTASVTVTPPPPPSTHDVAVTSVSAPGSVTQGSTVGVGVTVANQGTVSEAFTVTLRDGASTIGSSSRSLAAGASTTVNFSWNTSGAATGAHTLTATAGPVSGETDTADNSRTASVTVNGGSSGGLSLQVTMAGHPRPGQYVFIDVTVTNSGIPVSGASVDVVLDTQGSDQTLRKTTNAGGYASFRFLTKYNAGLPWTIRASASSGGLSGSKTCTYNGSSLLC